MVKKNLLIVIDSLKRGGAEILVTGLLRNLSAHFNVILVTLNPTCEFEEHELFFQHKYCLHFSNVLSLLPSIIKLKMIIRKHKPDLIHSHLIDSSLVSRCACPSSVPLLYSLHGETVKSDFSKSRILTLLEKYTIRKKHWVMAVSKAALNDYESIMGVKKRSIVLHNYIEDHFYTTSQQKEDLSQKNSLRIIAVGNINTFKNYQYIIDTFIRLKNNAVSLHIYGNTNHALFSSLQAQIDTHNLPIIFKNKTKNIQNILLEYDIFISSSATEGFGLAAIEAMAMGLPVLLSDIPVYREITNGKGLFFNLESPDSLVHLIRSILNNEINLPTLAGEGKVVAGNFRKKEYEKEILSIYYKLINDA